MNKKILSRQFLLSDIAILIYLALLKLIINMLFHGSYGYFRDELYYIICSDHLAWGYVDQPPFSIAILAISRWFLGDSLYAIRFTAALAGAGVVFLTGMMVRKLGGGRFAQIFGALAAVVSPMILGNGARYFSMNAFDLLFWALAAYIVILIIKNDNPKLWVLFGVIAGLGLLNKYSMLFFGFGLVVGLLLTSHRKHLINKWFWLAGFIVLIIILPHFLWEMKYDFPSIEFMRIASQEKNVDISFLDFLLGQFMQNGFGHAPIWLIGLFYYFFHKEGKQFRFLGWMYVITFAVLFAGNGRAYYLSPIYPIFLASGAVLIEKFIRNYSWNWLKPVLASLLIITSLISAPFVIPVLPVEKFINFTEFLGMTPKAEERHELEALPQYYADMFGWEEMVATVAKIYQNLTPKEQAKCVIYVRNYGEAGAIDFFGKKYGLPKAICAHNNYWLWGQSQVDEAYDVAIIFGWSSNVQENLEDLRRPDRYEHVEHAASTKCKYCMAYENNRPIFLCRNPKFSFKDIWPDERFYY